ncbi:MAG: ribosome biogenesis factor YjgA [Alcanivoracaceae bacterium]|jgi:ribosome-associated protein|nr:ribosome biogenesis factor YjgA [Alcanivoracaceae bacterium]
MDEYNDEHTASKTQQKKDAEDLQQQAERLMSLKPEQLARLPLHPDLEVAIEEAGRISKPDARRRHALFVAKLMRAGDLDLLLAALEKLDDPLREKRLHDWIERVANADSVKHSESLVHELTQWYPHADRQHLRNLVRQLLQGRPDAEQPDKEARQKFRRLRRRLLQYAVEVDRQAPLYDDPEQDWLQD